MRTRLAVRLEESLIPSLLFTLTWLTWIIDWLEGSKPLIALGLEG